MTVLSGEVLGSDLAYNERSRVDSGQYPVDSPPTLRLNNPGLHRVISNFKNT